MSYVAVGVTVGSAIYKGVSAGVARRKARKAAKKEKARIAAENEESAKNLKPGYDTLAQSQRDLGNTYAGQAAFDAESQYDRSSSERATSSAIEKAQRTGASSGEIMNMVSGLTARGQSRGQNISADTSRRRRELQGMSKAQAIKAAQTGLAGKQAMADIKTKTRQEGLQAQQSIYQAYGEQANYNAGVADDIAAAGMMYGNYKATGNLSGALGAETTATNVPGPVDEITDTPGVTNPYAKSKKFKPGIY